LLDTSFGSQPSRSRATLRVINTKQARLFNQAGLNVSNPQRRAI
jgi:hypothetical protein